MTQRDPVIRRLQAHKSELVAAYGVRRLALFGSLARDEATNQSDVDLLVEFDRAVGSGMAFDPEPTSNLACRVGLCHQKRGQRLCSG